MRRQFDEAQVTKILELATGLLPEKPRWVVLQDAGGVPIGSLTPGDLDAKVAVVAMSNALCERSLEISGNGDFRYAFMFGDKGIYFAIRLHTDQDMLGLGFEKLSSVDAIINTLPQMVNVLNNLLLD